MIRLDLEWREVLWWLQGGMAGSHLRWSVYEDFVNKVWPQCTEQQRRNIFVIARRDLGRYWRPDNWNGYDMNLKGEGPFREDIFDKTPMQYYRHVLARFDPDNQYAVTMQCKTSEDYQSFIRLANFNAVCIKRPYNIPKGDQWQSNTFQITVRTYLWEGEYRIDWNRRCAETSIVKTEKITIPDEGTM